MRKLKTAQEFQEYFEGKNHPIIYQCRQIGEVEIQLCPFSIPFLRIKVAKIS